MKYPHPRKLHIEITSRCNFTCPMCMKFSNGSDVGNIDLPFSAIAGLSPVFPHLEALVLNGIGEPLLHPQLPDIIRFCRDKMNPVSWIGLQSNGSFLHPDMALTLLDAGLNRLCLSIDSNTDNDAARNGHGIGHADHVTQAFANIRIARKTIKPQSFQLGVEIVLMRENYQELPAMLKRAAELGADFAIVSHLLAYQPEMEKSCLFNPNTEESTALFAEFCLQAKARDIKVDRSIFPIWHNPHDANGSSIFSLYSQMAAKAKKQNVTQHLASLIDWSNGVTAELSDIFSQTQETAESSGIDLRLPSVQAVQQRDCPFASNGACFITSQGDVTPCNALLHSYSCYMDGEEKKMTQKSFGNIKEAPLLSIWQSPEYQSWLEEMHDYGYPFCRSCALGPCADVTNHSYAFVNDCYGYIVPCGHCMWNLGALQCL